MVVWEIAGEGVLPAESQCKHSILPVKTGERENAYETRELLETDCRSIACARSFGEPAHTRVGGW